MDLEKIKKQWDDYNKEFDNSDFMDIETHTSMALKVGKLIREIERLKEYVDHLEQKNNLLYGRLNNIIALANKVIE